MSEFAKKILLITLDQTLVNRLLEQFAVVGYETATASTEQEAMNALTTEHPDLIILDLSIDRVDSFQIFEMLRGHANHVIATTPVIVATQGDDLLEIGRAIKLGAKDYFVKTTFDVARVMQKLHKQLGSPVTEGSTIPIAQMSEATSATPTEATPRAQAKLLIVEDDKFLRDLAAQKIMKEGMHVVVAIDGEEGVAVAEKELPDVVLLDILLPGIDGFEVLRRLRANPALLQTRVIMLSNFGQREDIEKALKAGADQFLVKANYTLDEIVEEVKKLMNTPRKT